MTAPNRRDILKWGSAAGVTGGLLSSKAFASVPKVSVTPMALPEVRKYKTLGRTGLDISDISFGSSRLRSGQEDIVRHAMDRGINYLDTAHSYSRGQSETVIGNAIKGKRDQVYLVSKAHTSAKWTTKQIMDHLEESLKRLKTDYVDVYLNHAVNDVERMKSDGWQEFVEKATKQGKIRFSGMSGHAGRLKECLEYSLDEDLCDVILVSYNFGRDPSFIANMTRGMDMVRLQPDLPKLLEKAKKKNVGTIAMKTLSGARLNDMREYETEEGTFAQAAFRWVLADSNVDALIVSMTSEALIDEYLVASGAEEVSYYDEKLLHRYAQLNSSTQCRQGCDDCHGSCPYNVQISDVLRTRMYATDYQDLEMARAEYANIEIDGTACLTCSGAPCKDACTYGLAIADLCAPTHRMLG